MHSLLRGCAGSGAVGLFFSAWEGGKELSRPGSGPAGPKEAPLGPAPHASVSLAMAVCICVGKGVCVAMVVLDGTMVEEDTVCLFHCCMGTLR